MDPILSPLLLLGSSIGALMSLYSQLSAFPPLEEDVGLPSYEFFLLDHDHGIYVFKEKYPSLEVYAPYYGFIFAVWSEQGEAFNWFHADTASLDTYAMSDFEPGTYPDYFSENTSTAALEVLDSKTGEVLQAIPYSEDLYSFSNFSSEGYADERLLNGFDFSDYNFDGIPDVGFMVASGSGGDTYEVWLYDLDLSRFVYHPELNQIGLYPDPNLERVIMGGQVNMDGSFGYSEWVWIDGILTEVARASQWSLLSIQDFYQKFGTENDWESELLDLSLAQTWDMYRVMQVLDNGQWTTTCLLYFDSNEDTYELVEGASLEDCLGPNRNLPELTIGE